MNEELKRTVHIALAADENFKPGLEVTRASMMRSCAHPERLAFHVFRESSELEARIRREFGTYKGSVMAFVRLYLPELLPDLDWVVYSDVDTIWNRDVCELWDSVVGLRQARECESAMLYWVRDMWSSRHDSAIYQKRVNTNFDEGRYGCSGVTVLNLRKMRETKLLARAISFTKQYGTLPYADQDILNALCNQDSAFLPVCWDVLGCWEDLPKDSRCVYHITGVGRHFHAKMSPVYPPQYQLWWNVRMGENAVHRRSRVLAKLWPLRIVIRMLPKRIRERVIRQMYFARELVKLARIGEGEMKNVECRMKNGELGSRKEEIGKRKEEVGGGGSEDAAYQDGDSRSRK